MRRPPILHSQRWIDICMLRVFGHNTHCNPHDEGLRFFRHAFPGCIAFWQLWGPVNTPIANVIMTLLRYWTTRSSCWTKTGLSKPPGRSWHNPSWSRRYVYLGRCPAHLLCPGRLGARGAVFPLANRGGGCYNWCSYCIQSSLIPCHGGPPPEQRPPNGLDFWIQRFGLLYVFSISLVCF